LLISGSRAGSETRCLGYPNGGIVLESNSDGGVASNGDERQRLEFVEDLIESIPFATLIINSKGKILLENTARRRLVRMAEESDRDDEDVSDFLSVLEQTLLGDDAYRDNVKEAFKKKTPVKFEITLSRKEGIETSIGIADEQALLVSIRPLDCGGRLDLAMIVLDDLSDRRRLGRELDFQKRLIKSMAEVASEGMIITDPCEKIAYTNEFMTTTLSIPANQLLGTSISNEGDDDEVLMVVEDTASSTDPEVLPNVFTPMFSARAQGLGFGLSLSKSNVERNRERIWIESTKGRGTVVTIAFPTREE